LIREIRAVSGTIGELLAAACQRAAAQTRLRLLVTMGAERPPGSMDFDELVTSARSAVQITPRSDGDLAIVGYTSGTTGLPKGLRAELGRPEPDGTGAGESS
jgi:acyl-coenzyme A synthetase/AMP-(fatty) acid ligase